MTLNQITIMMYENPVHKELTQDLYRSSDGSYRVQFDPVVHHEVSTIICSVVGDISKTDPIDLEPLHHTLDPDALNSLFRYSNPGHSGRSGSVEFTFAGYEVTVFADGLIEIEPV